MKAQFEFDKTILEDLASLIAEILLPKLNLVHLHNEQPDILPLGEACKFISCSKSTMYRYRMNGLKSYSKGKKIFFYKSDLEKWIKK